MRFQDRPLLTLDQANAFLSTLEEVFDFRLLTRARQRRVTATALARCDFDFHKLKPGLAHFGGRLLWKGGSMAQGHYVPDKRVLHVRYLAKPWAGKNYWKVQATILHELAHAVDLLCLTSDQRVKFFIAAHPYENHPDGVANLPEDWAFHRGAPYGHGHSWFDDTYHEGLGEAFAECFLAAFSDIDASHYLHRSTPKAIEAVRRILS